MIDAKARTEFSVSLENWNDGEIKQFKIPKELLTPLKRKLPKGIPLNKIIGKPQRLEKQN